MKSLNQTVRVTAKIQTAGLVNGSQTRYQLIQFTQCRFYRLAIMEECTGELRKAQGLPLQHHDQSHSIGMLSLQFVLTALAATAPTQA
jgi:hypothetical protein